MSIIDLSHLIIDKMPTYPSDPNVSFVKVKEITEGETLLHKFEMGTHTGTHLDVPAHVILGSKTLNDFSLDNFHGRAVRVNKDTYHNLDKIAEKIDGIIYDTNWYRYFKKPEIFYGSERPPIPKNLISKAQKLEIKFFGCDLPSVDTSGSKSKPVHHAFMKKNIILYESLTNLEKLPLLKPFDFYGFPLPLDALDGSPIRAVGII